MGGYEGDNGRKIKWGTLYRSDNLHRLSARHFEAFNQLNLTAVIDFRSSYEKSFEPNRFPSNKTFKVVELPIFDRANQTMGKNLQEKIRKGDVGDIDGNALMLRANRQFALEYIPEFRHFLHHILEAEGKPVLFHCTGGKDRTGFATALLLTILGVSKETIFQDYLLSNQLILPALKSRMRLYAMIRGPKALQVVEELARVTPAYLGAAFAAIEVEYGNFDNYVQQALTLSKEDVEELRNSLLV